MILSEGNGQLKGLAKLQKSSRERRRRGQFVLEGEKLVREAAAQGMLERAYVSESAFERGGPELSAFLERQDYELVSDGAFARVADTVTPQGILGLARLPEHAFGEIMQDARRCVLLLDDLRDPGNLGTILRTAEGADMSGVVLGRGCVDAFNPKVVRATMGAVFRVSFCYVEDLAEAAEQLKAAGMPVYGATMQGSLPYDQVDYRTGAGFVVGNEAQGISDKVLSVLSGGVRIPMAGSLESLNAAVCAALLMYEAARQRGFASCAFGENSL